MPTLRRVLVTLAILTVCLALSFASGATPSDPFVEVQLCQEVHGFAGEVNDHLLIKVPEDVPETGTPIYAIARAFPVQMGAMVQSWLSMNATVDGVRGTVAASDDNGIMRISGVSKGKTLRINVNRMRADGPVPFRLYTYQASTFTCAIPISESNAFIAPLPNDQSLVFFAVSVPKVYPCATIWIQHDHGFIFGDTTAAPVEKRYFYVVDSSNKRHLYLGGDTVCHRSATEPLIIAYYSHDQSPDMPLVRIRVSYGEGPASEAIPESPGSAGGTGDEPETGGTPGKGTDKKTTGSAGGGFFASLGRLLLVAFLLGAAYLIAGSVYNYRSRGVTTFPEYVPHVDAFRSAVATAMNKGAPRHEYSPLNTAGAERNPFEV